MSFIFQVIMHSLLRLMMHWNREFCGLFDLAVMLAYVKQSVKTLEFTHTTSSRYKLAGKNSLGTQRPVSGVGLASCLDQELPELQTAEFGLHFGVCVSFKCGRIHPNYRRSQKLEDLENLAVYIIHTNF